MTAVLYILMRNDLASMNSGKAMAQASHAANAFVYHLQAFAQTYNTKPTDAGLSILNGFNSWENATSQGFGTVLTLEGGMTSICNTVNIFKALGYIADIIHDPTYPLVDGNVVHYIPLDTCAYVFVPDKETDMIAKTLLSSYSLHR